MEGLRKIESAVSGSQVEGFYELLKGAVSHTSSSLVQPPLKKHHATPTMTISHLPPQEPERVAPKVSGSVAEKEKQVLEVSYSSISRDSRAHMSTCNPFASSWGASKGCINARLKVAQRGHQAHMPLSVLMCAECTWGGVGVSLLWQIVLQSRCTQMPQEKPS